jgi:AcrR family transcriptional regulator
MATRTRRTQEERSAATRDRLLQATFECLVDVGYGRTSTPEVLRRSGISRGALLHHFPTKVDLTTAAVDYVFEKQLAEYRETFAILEGETEFPAAQAIDLLWTKLSGDTFYAWLELVVASRTDPVLLERVRAVTTRFDQNAAAIRQDFFPPPEKEDPYYKVAVAFSFATLTGLGVSRIFEPEYRVRKVIEPLKMLATLVDQNRQLGSGSSGESS